MAPKQAPSFDIAKANVLNKLLHADKSPKGSVDAPIAHLVHRINGHADYVSTSCCSGRIVLFAAAAAGERRGGRWLLTKHDTVTSSELQEKLGSLGRGQNEVVVASDPEANGSAQGGTLAEGGDLDGLVTFKLEPPILHVMCRDVAAAKCLLKHAISAGFRESGIVLSATAKIIIAIRSTANSLELPVATGARARQSSLLGVEYLDFLAAYANGKYVANLKKIEALMAAFVESVEAAGETCVACETDKGGLDERSKSSAVVERKLLDFAEVRASKVVGEGESGDPEAGATASAGAEVRGDGNETASVDQARQSTGPLSIDSEGALLDSAFEDESSTSELSTAKGSQWAVPADVAVASAAKVKHFVNLTNGLEAIHSLVQDCGLPREAIGFVRIQSSHCEVRDVFALLNNLDHSLLLYLALGFRCRVYDFGSRRKRWQGEGYNLFVPSALWWGLEVVRYALSRLWGLQSASLPILHGHNAQDYVDAALHRYRCE